MSFSSSLKNYGKNFKACFKAKHFIFYAILLLGMAICFITALILGSDMKMSTTYLLEQIGYTIIAVVSLSLIVGFLGELSLGHAAFMSIGAMFGTLVSNNLPFTSSMPLLSLIIAMVVGAVSAGAFGFLIGLPALRLKGDYLAIVTLAFGEIVKTVFQNLSLFGGALGLTNKYRFDMKYLFIIIFIVAFIMIVLTKNLIRSKVGGQIMAVRDNEIAAKSMGVNSNYIKVFVFVLSAMMAGVAGVFYGASQDVISSSQFSYNYSINNILIMVIIGGMGTIDGSVLSAIVVTIIDFKLQDVLSGDLAAIKNIIFAALLIGIILYRNVPQLARFREKYNVGNLIQFIKKKFLKIFLKKEYSSESDYRTYTADWTKVPTKIDMDAQLKSGIIDKDPDSKKGGNI